MTFYERLQLEARIEWERGWVTVNRRGAYENGLERPKNAEQRLMAASR